MLNEYKHYKSQTHLFYFFFDNECEKKHQIELQNETVSDNLLNKCYIESQSQSQNILFH
jgi:hypothetical protein